MKVQDLILYGSPVTVRADATLDEASRLMVSRGIRHLPVVENGKLLGVLSERDILAFRGYGGMLAPVRNVMTAPVETVKPDDDANDVAERMATRKIGCFPVVENGKVVGIVTTTDLLTMRAHERTPARQKIQGEVGEAMTRDPQIARPDDYLLDAIGRMSTNGLRHLPVVDGDNRVVGMLSDRDVRQAVGDLQITNEDGIRRGLRDMRVNDVASWRPLTITEDAPLEEAVRRFVDHRVGALPVINETGILVGVLSYVDVLRRLAGGLQEPTGVVSAPPEPELPAS